MADYIYTDINISKYFEDQKKNKNYKKYKEEINNIYKKYKNLEILNDILSILKAMAFALIFSTLITIFINAIFKNGIILFENINYFLIILMVISFIAIRKYKIYPIIVMLICGALNLFINII